MKRLYFVVDCNERPVHGPCTFRTAMHVRKWLNIYPRRRRHVGYPFSVRVARAQT